MAIYRFKVCLEDNEDVYRDIDIIASQTFEHFHIAIQEAFKFDSKHASSFFVSDDFWRKGQEITLRKEDLPLEEEEIRKKVDPKKLMSETRIASHIDQPHQRFVYVFDPVAQWTFLVEMIKIGNENPGASYPLLIRSNGTSPKQYKQTAVPKEDQNADLTMNGLLKVSDTEEEEEVFAEGAVESVEEEDLSGLEGEEVDNEAESGDEEAEDFGTGEAPEEDSDLS